MKKDVNALFSVSLAAMNVASSTTTVDKDIVFDAREDVDDSHSTRFDNSIPSMDGIPIEAFQWHE